MKLTFKYKQWSRGWLILGLGFDPHELALIKFDFDLCLQHREFMVGLMLLGFIVDFWVMEPLPDRIEETIK